MKKRLKFNTVLSWKVVNILEMANRRVKRSEMWDFWVLVEGVWGTFDLAELKLSWGHLVHLKLSDPLLFICARQTHYFTFGWYTHHLATMY